MATHSNNLAWRIPWTEESGGIQSMGLQRGGRDWAANTHTYNSLDVSNHSSLISSSFSHDEAYYYLGSSKKI